METPELLTTYNEPNDEKIPEEEKVSRDDENLTEESKDASSGTGFEKDKWYQYYTIVTILLVAVLLVTSSLALAMAVYMLRISFSFILEHLFATQCLVMEL